MKRRTISVTSGPKSDQIESDPSISSAFIVTQLPGWRISGRGRIWRPAIDLFETEDQYIGRVEIAGMQDGEFGIFIHQGTMVVHGVRKDILKNKKAFHQMEIPFGEFQVEVEIPGPVDTDHMEAQYSDGFLWVILNKITPRVIHIHIDGEDLE